MTVLQHAMTNEKESQMTIRKRIGIVVLAAMLGAIGLELGGQFRIPVVSDFISTAVAQANRTVSPVRVQNTARADWSGCIPALGGC
jgi:hypothetical protein